jgi:hypothetical protein
MPFFCGRECRFKSVWIKETVGYSFSPIEKYRYLSHEHFFCFSQMIEIHPFFHCPGLAQNLLKGAELSDGLANLKVSKKGKKCIIHPKNQVSLLSCFHC